MQHGQEQTESPRVQPLRKPARRLPGIGIDQCLDFHQQGARTLARDKRRAPRHGLGTAGKKDGRRILDLPEALLAHDEESQFVGGAEAVLRRSDDAKPAAQVAFEVQHGIDHVLEHTGTGQRALLGHVADENRGHTLLFGEPDQLRSAFAKLCDGARCGFQALAEQRLDGIDDQNLRRLRRQRTDDALHAGLRQQLHRRLPDTQTVCAKADLVERFLPRDVAAAAIAAEVGDGAEQQRGLADPGITADEDHGAGHQAAAKHAVQFPEPAAAATHPGHLQTVQTRHGGSAGRSDAAYGMTGPGRRGFTQRIPFSAIRTLTLPLELTGATG